MELSISSTSALKELEPLDKQPTQAPPTSGKPASPPTEVETSSLQAPQASSSTTDAPDKPVTGVTFQFTVEQLAILQKTREAIKGVADKQERRRLVKNAKNEILEREKEKKLSKNEKILLLTAVGTWFAAFGKKKRFNKKHTKRWTGRQVLYELQKPAVLARRKELFEEAVEKGLDPATEFSYHQIALTELWEKLKADQQDRMSATAKNWNDDGVDPAIKAR